jgi:tyrosyl-tRNA synthetase
MKLSETLEKRGLIHQFSAPTLTEITDGHSRTIYLGVDPTADSMHVGNLAVCMLLRHFVDAGHKVIFLVGGGTGMIGDPKPDVERPLTPPEIVAERVNKLKIQAQKLLGGKEVLFVNNYDWLSQLNLIEFLRDIGKHFTVNELIKKDAIATRLKSETGISYTEFAYPLLQAYDFLTLFRQQHCEVQVSGSDQWGNIVAGVDLVRKLEQKTVYAVTAPLIVDKASGKKFGKSEGNAIWLDGEKTTPYEFYQFWLNTSDESAVDFLKVFTLLSLEEIEEIAKDFIANPSGRRSQTTLAYEVTAFVHGEDVAKRVAEVSAVLFGEGELNNLNEAGLVMLLEHAPKIKVKTADVLVDVLVESQLATSKREARTFIESGAVTLNNTKVSDVTASINESDFVNKIALLRRGKKNLCILEID